MRLNFRNISILIPIVMLPLGIWLGYRAFRDHSLPEIVDAVFGISSVHLGLAFGCAAASYLCLTGSEMLAVRYAGRTLPYRKVALTSFVSLSIGHNVGVAALSSGALRYRFYSRFGLSALDVGRIIVFCGVTVALGLLALGGLVLSLRPALGADMLGLSTGATRGLALLSLGLAGGYVGLAWRVRRPICIRGHAFRLPTVRIAALQLAAGTVDFAFVAATLHQLIAAAAGYPEMVAAYVLGNAAALMSHVPGGLGVLEYVIASLVGQEGVVAALIAFRIVYFLVPLALGGALLVAAELVRLRGK